MVSLVLKNWWKLHREKIIFIFNDFRWFLSLWLMWLISCFGHNDACITTEDVIWIFVQSFEKSLNYWSANYKIDFLTLFASMSILSSKEIFPRNHWSPGTDNKFSLEKTSCWTSFRADLMKLRNNC